MLDTDDMTRRQLDEDGSEVIGAAAAFADREAAARVVGSIRAQGYPLEIRVDGSPSQRWVVWIGAQPRGRRR